MRFRGLIAGSIVGILRCEERGDTSLPNTILLLLFFHTEQMLALIINLFLG